MPRNPMKLEFPAAGVVRRAGLRIATGGRGPFPAPWATLCHALFSCRMWWGGERKMQRPFRQPFAERAPVDTDCSRPFRKAHCHPVKSDLASALAVLAGYASGRQCVRDWPTAREAVVKCLARYSKLFCPIDYALCNAIEGYKSSAPSVAQLRCTGSPYAVVLGVSRIVIESFDRVLRRRSRPHVAVKCLERFPFVAHGDTPPAVVMIGIRCDTTASPSHSQPSDVFRSSAHAVCFDAAVCATLAAPYSECWTRNLRVRSAVTDAVPVALTWNVANRFVNNGPMAESLAGQIYEPGATRSRISLVHQKNLHFRFGRWIGPGGSNDLPLGPFQFTRRRDWGLSHAA